jgi:hypothetical protein
MTLRNPASPYPATLPPHAARPRRARVQRNERELFGLVCVWGVVVFVGFVGAALMASAVTP